MSKVSVDEAILDRIDALETKIKNLTLREEALKEIQHRRIEAILDMLLEVVTVIEGYKPVD